MSTKNVRVVELNKKPCELTVLVDTGSPVSFVAPWIVKEYLNEQRNDPERSTRKFLGLNNLPIEIGEIIRVDARLQSLPNVLCKVALNVLTSDEMVHDLILGRDFLSENQITLIYKPRKTATGGEEIDVNFFTELPRLEVATCGISDNTLLSAEI